MSSFPHRMRIAAVLAAGALAVAGCSSSSSDGGAKKPSSSDTLSQAKIFVTGVVGSGNDSGTPKQGGQLTIADYGEPRSLNPIVTYADGATGGSAMAAIYDELMRYDYTTQTFVPQLAQSLTGSDGDKTWTLKLRDGVKFTNGQPLNAAAVLGSLKYYNDNHAFQSNLMLANVASMKASDPMTVVFTLRQPWSAFPDMLAQGPGMIMAPAAYQDPKAFKPIGAGPFTYGSYAPGESLVLNANPDYVGGKPYLDSLKFVWIGGTDDQAKVDALDSGSADTAMLRDSQVITKARTKGLGGMMFPSGSADTLWINTRTGHPGSNLQVRQAISLAVDTKAYGERIRGGTGLPGKGLFGSTSPWYTGGSDQYDPTKAKQLLKEAEASGFDGKLNYVYNASPSDQAGAVTLKAMLENVGFKVTLVPLRSVADQVQRLYVNHDFDLAVAGTTIPDLDPYARLASTFNAQSPTNLSGWGSPEMDQLLTQLQAKDTPDQGKTVMAQIEKLWEDQVPGFSLDSGGVFQAWNKNVHGVDPTSEDLLLYNKAWKS